MSSKTFNLVDRSTPVISCIGVGQDRCHARIEAQTRSAARHLARRAGWEEAGRDRSPSGHRVDCWICPACAERARALYRGAHRSLRAYDGDALEQRRRAEAELREISQRNQRARSRFERGYHHVLTGEQMAACETLRYALDRIEISGNATANYDGVSVDSFHYGDKMSSIETAIRARTFERRCQDAVVGRVQMMHHDAWRVFRTAVERDLTPQETGDLINRSRRDNMGQKKRRALAIAIVEACAEAIRAIRY